ncbi:S-4TM family putative pore-forming effector [Chromohalobacter israelensis]|uniref:S-4TM family putative pore-forming effector n=1 Tax=Chromohalobacter israelensis TaxID=141390 RepID=UPI00265BAC5D|nr:S-4TM family putative pore-forming effector [Chromohalobacter salexigens]MDO0944834.1 S-4TM family putative pore-forming effector [Chromohalobacter salexigens]
MSIPDEQNKDFYVKRIAASKFLYSRAKTLLGCFFFFNVVVVFLFSLISVLLNSEPLMVWLGFEKVDVSGWVSSLSLVIVVLSNVLLLPYIEKTKTLAAKLQDLVDRQLFGLPENPLVVGDAPGEDVAYRYGERYLKRFGRKSVEDWYPSNIGDLDRQCQALLCQLSCVSWDLALRRRFNICIVGLGVLIFLFIFLISLFGNMQVEEIVKNMIAVVAPVFSFGYAYYTGNAGSIVKAESLNGAVRDVVNSVDGCNEFQAGLASISSLQDQIFLKRVTDWPLPDFFYERFRGEQQEEMSYSAESLVKKMKGE